MGYVNCFVCDNCSDHSDVSYMTVYNCGDEKEWCESCVDNYSWSCEDCGTVYAEGEAYITYGRNTHICECCCTDGFTYCDTCNEYERNEDLCEEDEVDAYVHSYSYKPDPIFHGDGPAYFGIELEVECRNASRPEMAQLVTEQHGMDVLYLKEDGSLSHGFEIVSHPRSVDSWKEFAPQLGQTLSQLSKSGVKSWSASSCGLHVHMSKAGMSNSHMARFGLLFSRNALEWESVARRTSGYASFNRLKDDGGVLLKVIQPYSASHTDAVNFGNRTTIEVRIWRPSLMVERVLAVVELMALCRAYTASITSFDVARGALDWSRFSLYAEIHGNANTQLLMRGDSFRQVVA